jgi:hypothetical protein
MTPLLLDPGIKEVAQGDWFCKSCLKYSNDVASNVEIEACGGFVTL